MGSTLREAREAPARARTIAELTERLLGGADPAGGWAYYPGKASRLESTSWALRALSDADPSNVARHRAFFDRCRRPDGLFVDLPGTPPNYCHNALALLALLDRPSLGDRAAMQATYNALLAATGMRTPPSPAIRQDNMLEGWSWIDGTFSWVEPTSWSLVALKRAAKQGLGPSAAHRVEEGEKLLVDRCCETGGWNYGNSNVLGTNLAAYVPVTAVALLALGNRRDLPAASRSLGFLERHATAEPSGMALSLALISLRVYERSVEELEAALIAQWQRTGFLGNLCTTAMALCALAPQPRLAGTFGV